MDILRRARRLTCLVLGWFVLFVGIAVAAPLLQTAGGDDVICSGTGGTMAMPSDQGDPASGHHDMKDCKSCVLTGLPSGPIVFDGTQPLADAPIVVPEVCVEAQAEPPYSARAPPLF